MAFSRGLVAALVTSQDFQPGETDSRQTSSRPLSAPPNPLAILLLGPTGSGKTALSLALATMPGLPPAEIVSCDSVAVYRGMDLGSAKPTPSEQAQVPHHLIDVANPDQPMTAGEYSRRARQAMHAIAARGHMPIVTGGTGLYLRALTMGLFDGPERRPELRERLRRTHARHHIGWLHRLLHRLDPISAARIHANDTPKLIRAIEVSLTAGQPLSSALENGRDPLTGFRLLRIGLNPPRQALYDRLNQRAAAMFQSGLVEETQILLNRYGRIPALDALGYRQALAVIDQQLNQTDAIAAAQQGHRNYAKRQLTWFRREPDVHWIEDFGASESAISTAVALISHPDQPGSSLPADRMQPPDVSVSGVDRYSSLGPNPPQAEAGSQSPWT